MCSDRAARRRAVPTLGAAVLLAVVSWSPARGKVFMSQDDALAIAFPDGAEVERRTAFLTDAQAAAVKGASGQEPTTRVITWYQAGGRTAWFDTHIVRTLPETIMIVVGKDAAIERIDVLSFGEPEEYLPPRPWYKQMNGRRLDDELSLRRAIRPVTGATLSGRAVVEAARRVLALHGLLVPKEPPGGDQADPRESDP